MKVSEFFKDHKSVLQTLHGLLFGREDVNRLRTAHERFGFTHIPAHRLKDALEVQLRDYETTDFEDWKQQRLADRDWGF